jgi:hypothetical protein
LSLQDTPTPSKYRETISLSNTVGISVYIILISIGLYNFNITKEGFGKIPANVFMSLGEGWGVKLLGVFLWVFITGFNVIRFYLTSWLVDDDEVFKKIRCCEMKRTLFLIELGLRTIIWILIFTLAVNLTNHKSIELFLLLLYIMYVVWDFVILFYFKSLLALPSIRYKPSNAELSPESQNDRSKYLRLFMKVKGWLVIESIGLVATATYFIAVTFYFSKKTSDKPLYVIFLTLITVVYFFVYKNEIKDKESVKYYVRILAYVLFVCILFIPFVLIFKKNQILINF